MADKPYITNDLPLQLLSSSPSERLQSSLEEILQTHPPIAESIGAPDIGFFSGHTGLSLLLLQLSALRPDLQVHGHGLQHWAKEYFSLVEDTGKLGPKTGCGLCSGKLCYGALRACITKSQRDVDAFIANIPAVIDPTKLEADTEAASDDGSSSGGDNDESATGDNDPFPSEMIYGRSAVLYMLRLIKFWVPDSAASLEQPMAQLAEKIMETEDDQGNWKWLGKVYIGPPHGIIGIITQLVLTNPNLAPKYSNKLVELLDQQGPDGNWPSQMDEERGADGWKRVQFCHGAPGMVLTLRRLRPFYPELQDRIDVAIERGMEMTWERGHLTKEPNLCHGTLGNALAFPIGQRREHFLALCTPDAVRKAKEQDVGIFRSAAYDLKFATTFHYLPSAIWTWAVCEMEQPPMLLFDDV